MFRIYIFIVSMLGVFLLQKINAQSKNKNLTYVDNKGVMRFTKDKKEASFFGINYIGPFAYGYRSHKALNVNPEKAIDIDVYHFARLGQDVIPLSFFINYILFHVLF